MKKAKPSKGSARTKKFDAGGLAALAGLGTLAYLMRKKKGEDSKGSAPTDTSDYSSSRADVRKMIEGSRDDDSRTPSSTKFGGESNLGTSVTETGTRPGPDTTADENKPAPTPAPKKVVTKKATPAPSKVSSVGMTGIPISTSGKPNEERTSKPYPENVKKPETSTSGIVPKNTFLTKERLDKAKDSMRRYREEEKAKKTRSTADIRAGRYRSGGSVGSASKRADGIAQRGKTRGRVL